MQSTMQIMWLQLKIIFINNQSAKMTGNAHHSFPEPEKIEIACFAWQTIQDQKIISFLIKKAKKTSRYSHFRG